MRASTLLLVLVAALVAAAEDAKVDPVRIPAIVDLGNKKCPVDGKEVAQDAFIDWNGVRAHLCCDDCKAKFEKGPAAALKKLNLEVVTIGKLGTFVDLMNQTCPIMGKPAKPNFTTDLSGVRVHYCCGKCPAKAAKDPAATYKALGYGYMPSVVDLRNQACPMSGKPADPAVFADSEGIRVRFCCGDCLGAFQKDPAAAFAKLGVDPAKLRDTVK
jgi:hypothetical protein